MSKKFWFVSEIILHCNNKLVLLNLLTHRVCVFAWHFVVANLDSRRNVLSVVSAKARKIIKTLCSVWLFCRGVLEIASRLSRYTWFVRRVGSIPI